MEPFINFVSRNFGTPLVKTSTTVNTNFRKVRVSQRKSRTLAHIRTTRLHEADYYSYSLRAGCSGSESRCGKVFSHPSSLDQWPTHSPVQWVHDLSRGAVAGA
jgi:hypothetical protein